MLRHVGRQHAAQRVRVARRVPRGVREQRPRARWRATGCRARPQRESERTARSAAGVCPRVRSEARAARGRERAQRRATSGLEADALLVGLDGARRRPAQVDRRRRSPRCSASCQPPTSAERLAQASSMASSGPARPAPGPPEKPTSTRSARCRPSVAASAGSTISVSTPPVDLGCRNATRLSRMPVRGSSSISRSPASRTRSSAASMSSVPVGDVVQPGPLRSMNLPTPVSGQRREQLDVALADLEQHRLDALLLDGLAVLLGHAEAVRGRARRRRRGPRRRRRCGRSARTRAAQLHVELWLEASERPWPLRLTPRRRPRPARSASRTPLFGACGADDALDVRALEHLVLEQGLRRAPRAGRGARRSARARGGRRGR